MNKFWKISNKIVLGFLILICGLGTFYKHISFGLGLGDMVGYFVLYSGTLLHLILTINSRKQGAERHIILSFSFLLFATLIILKATIWRGSEYKWNGSLFYLPCPTEIKVNNDEFEKKLLIQMCTMTYYSKFTGVWNGKYIIIKKDNVLIPNELEKYIKFPIHEIEIESKYHVKMENEILTKEFNFKKDTLKLNQEYKLSGEVIGIKNFKPILKVYLE